MSWSIEKRLETSVGGYICVWYSHFKNKFIYLIKTGVFHNTLLTCTSTHQEDTRTRYSIFHLFTYNRCYMFHPKMAVVRDNDATTIISEDFFILHNNPQWVRASSFTRFLDETQRHTTVGMTPLDEWSARRRDLYLTTHNTHNRQTQPQQASGRRRTPYTARPLGTPLKTITLYEYNLQNFQKLCCNPHNDH